MIAAVALLACACAVLGATLWAVLRELVRMVRFLRARDEEGSARVTVGLPLRALRELAAAVNEQLDAIQTERVRARRRSEGFRRELASLSHDIRTPLMGARGRLQLAVGEADAAERSEGIRAAAARLDDVERLLDQLFDYARASDPDLALATERVEVLPVVEHVLAGQFAQIEAAGLEPEVRFAEPGFAVEADRAALTRVLENVVSNAVRHGAPGPLAVSQRGGTLSVSNEVADPSAVDPERIFERFWRANGARSGEGAGIGLSVVASLCERMGFSASARLDGSRLTVLIELA